MNTIYITVENLIAALEVPATIVSDNNGYQIEFDFDEAWDGYPLKTAVFVWYRDSLPCCQMVPFSDRTVQVPLIPAVNCLYVGVTAGNLQTTTPAMIPCSRSILSSGGEEPAPPTESEYAQLMALVNATVGASAYELAVAHGYEGSEEQWLESLKGEQGIQGRQGPQGATGPAGADGSPGADGYTPVKGTDYWTEADKAAIQAQCNDLLVAELANRSQLVPEFANDISQCSDTSKLYVLPDGYIYAYMGVTSIGGDTTNHADPSGSEWLTDYRLGMDAQALACVKAIVTNYIAVQTGDVVRVKGLAVAADALTSYPNTPKQAALDANKNSLYVSRVQSGNVYWTYAAEDDVSVVTITGSNVAYMRFTGELMDGYTAQDVVITVNEKSGEGTATTVYQWANTGHAFVSTGAEGGEVAATGENAHAEGYKTVASGDNSHAEGKETAARSRNSHAEGEQSATYGVGSHAEGYATSTGEDASYSHAEGSEAQTSGYASHAEGDASHAEGSASHAEGYACHAEGYASHAEGEETTASGSSSHAEGGGTTASGDYSHAEGGDGTTASGDYSHAEGAYTKAKEYAAHSEGEGTIAAGESQHAEGKWNIEDTDGKYAHIIGNGNSVYRSNAHTVDWDGNAWYAGTVEGAGLILKSTSGKRFLVTVDDTGALNTAQIT